MKRHATKHNTNQPEAVQNLKRTKTTQTPQRNKTRTSRAKFWCKPELSELMRVANLVKEYKRFDPEEYILSRPAFEREVYGDQFLYYFGRLMFVRDLPSELRTEVYCDGELERFEKADSHEFWLNNNGLAQDTLRDLNVDGQLSDEEYGIASFERLESIADILITFGYYGKKYSYSESLRKKREKSGKDTSFIDDVTSNDRMTPVLIAYHKLLDTREFLLSIINLSKDFQETSSKNLWESTYEQIKRERIGELAFRDNETLVEKTSILAPTFAIDKEGRIQFSVSRLAAILQGADITRIRLCEVCDDIFWAKRKDAFACSPKHSKVRQMRLLRKNWDDKGQLYLSARRKKRSRRKS